MRYPRLAIGFVPLVLLVLSVTGSILSGLPRDGVAAEAEKTYKGHGLAMHGDLKYGPDFTHFEYVNPEAPKGGTVTMAGYQGFDSFNPYIIKGRPAAGANMLHDTLMVSSADEPFSMYGLIAETVETPPDRSWTAFTLREEARWHDGKPITVDDVIWTFNTLMEEGAPFYRYYYHNVDKVSQTGPRTVRFDFKPGENHELPLILGQLPVLPKHYYAEREFNRTTLEPPLGSGPYKVKRVDVNHAIEYERVEDYWAKDLPVMKGQYNFDLLRFEYYRDETVALEAFKGGDVDYREENNSKFWATSYEFPAIREGLVKKEEVPHDRSTGMQGFVYNMRRPIFQDDKVRQALAYAFDFPWSNKTLFYGQYARTRSFFENSELEAEGLPEGRELEILERFRGKVPEAVFTTEYQPPTTDGSGNIRGNLREAVALLEEAGWSIDPDTRKLTHTETGRVMAFEILLVSPAFERIVLPFTQNLKRLGIEVSVRQVDTAQYQQRLNTFDFDMIVGSWGQSLSPGNEQRDFWSSEAADREGSRNYTGLQDPAVDELIEMVIAAPDRAELVARVRALDRVLQWRHIVIPNWHIPYDRLAYWDKFGQPEVIPTRGSQFFDWWVVPEKAEKLRQAER